MQKHAASHLLYDLFLEMNSTDKRWAILKGLPINPAEKRLAVLMEVHPYSYKDFELAFPMAFTEPEMVPVGIMVRTLCLRTIN